MRTNQREQPRILTQRDEEILQTIHFYRYMTALDVSHLLFSPQSVSHVREILTRLAGGGDFLSDHYLFRFKVPDAETGNKERIFTLGAKDRNFLRRERGIPVTWYFRPDMMKHLTYGQVLHNLVLTRFLVAAHCWSNKQQHFKLLETRIGYELANTAIMVRRKSGGAESVNVTPDAWLLFERQDGKRFPLLLEIDRGSEYRQKFHQHVRARIEYIRSGTYKKLFGYEAVMILYVTTGETPTYREKRQRTMCAWTQEVLTELHKEQWASVFYFQSVVLKQMYKMPLFQEAGWAQPNSDQLIPLFPL